MSSPRLCASSSRPKSSRPPTIRDSGSARSSPRTGSASSNATAEGRSLVRVEAAAGLAAVMTGAVALLDAARWPVLLAPRGLIDRRTDHEREVDAGEIHETERSERMAERLLRGQVDLLEGGVALVDEESRLAAEGTEQPIRDEPLHLLAHQH